MCSLRMVLLPGNPCCLPCPHPVNVVDQQLSTLFEQPIQQLRRLFTFMHWGGLLQENGPCITCQHSECHTDACGGHAILHAAQQQQDQDCAQGS